MLKSKSSAGVPWIKPWAGLFDFSALKTVAYPWACLTCGVVLLFLDNVAVLAEEYRSERTAVPAQAASAIKP